MKVRSPHHPAPSFLSPDLDLHPGENGRCHAPAYNPPVILL
jgi:hypothetical protein